jgi:ATP synthase F1 delta subunit
MNSSKFSRTSLAEYITSALDKKTSGRLKKEVAAYLLEKGKTSEVDSLLRDVVAERVRRDNTVEVTAITAHPLTDPQRAEIEDHVKTIYPGARKVIINSRIDQSVIGGVRLEFSDKLLDLTVSAKLNKLKTLTR